MFLRYIGLHSNKHRQQQLLLLSRNWAYSQLEWPTCLPVYGHIWGLLDTFDMGWAESTHTPLCTYTLLQLVDGSITADSKLVHSIVGALLYITVTCPDLSFSINKPSQFMHKPTQINFQQLKKVMRHPKLTIKKLFDLQLYAFSDADWDDRIYDHIQLVL